MPAKITKQVVGHGRHGTQHPFLTVLEHLVVTQIKALVLLHQVKFAHDFSVGTLPRHGLADILFRIGSIVCNGKSTSIKLHIWSWSHSELLTEPLKTPPPSCVAIRDDVAPMLRYQATASQVPGIQMAQNLFAYLKWQMEEDIDGDIVDVFLNKIYLSRITQVQNF